MSMKQTCHVRVSFFEATRGFLRYTNRTTPMLGFPILSPPSKLPRKRGCLFSSLSWNTIMLACFFPLPRWKFRGSRDHPDVPFQTKPHLRVGFRRTSTQQLERLMRSRGSQLDLQQHAGGLDPEMTPETGEVTL